jgi:phage terminase large subunit-like protein
MIDLENLTPDMIENLGQDELEELTGQILGMLGKNEEEQRENLQGLKEAALVEKARVFDLEGFKAFFELMNGFPLHPEGEVWAKNIFLAIGSSRKLLQEAFRGSGKTTVISKFFFAFYIGHHPWTTNMIVRVNTQKARETALEVATIIESDRRWRKVFPNVVPDKPRGWGAETGYYLRIVGLVENDEDADYSAWLRKCSDTMRPSGATFIGYGYDSGSNQGSRTNGVLLVDDIHDKNNTNSDKQLADVKNYVKEILLPIPVPGQGIEIWNYTPWLVNDAYAERQATGMYIHSHSPVMFEVEESEALEDGKIKDGYIFWNRDWQLPEDIVTDDSHVYPFSNKYYRLSWPDRWTQEEIARKFKDILTVAFARMYMLDIKATEGLKLRGEWLHRFPHDRIDNSWPIIAGIDYASVTDRLKHKDRDYFAMALGAIVPGGGLVLIDGVRKQVTFGEALNVANQMCADYAGRIQAIGVEAIGKGEEFFSQFRFANDIFGHPLPVFPIAYHQASKGKRFEEYLAPRFQFSRIWVTNKDNDFVKYFENEWLSYPNGEHDDCLDAVYMMAQMADPHLAIDKKKSANAPDQEKKKIHPLIEGFARR